MYVVYWLSHELSIRLNHVMVEVLLGHQSSAGGRAAIEQVTIYIMYVPMYYLPYFAWYPSGKQGNRIFETKREIPCKVR